MSKHILRINSPDDEIEEYYLDGEYLMATNHDEHGWDGMEGVRNAFTKICEKLKVKIEHTNEVED